MNILKRDGRVFRFFNVYSNRYFKMLRPAQQNQRTHHINFFWMIAVIIILAMLVGSAYAQQPTQLPKDTSSAPGINLGAKATVAVDAKADVQAGISMSPLDNLRSKIFLGVGVGYNLPMSTGLRDNNSASVGGHVVFG